MKTDTLTGKVDENVFPADSFPHIYFDAVGKGEKFALTGFDSEKDARESAKRVVSDIKYVFGTEYACSVQQVGEGDYNLKCALVR